MLKTQRFGLLPAAPVNGVRAEARLNNKVHTRYVQIVAQEQVDITTAGTGLRNRGSVWASFDEVGINDNGDDRVLVDGPTLRYISEMHAPSALATRRLGSPAVQAATIIRESARIWFAHPLAANPSETTFIERDEKHQVTLFYKWNNAITRLVDGPVVGTVSNPVITAYQEADRLSQVKPIFIPTMRQIVRNIASANPQEEVLIKAQNPIRAIVIKQETDSGEVGDIITSLRLLSDARAIIGPNFVSWRDLTLAAQYEFGGDVSNPEGSAGLGVNAYLGLNFQEGGRLSNVLDAPREPNLRFEFNVQPSAFGANSKIRITLLELEREAGITADEAPFTI
jgi:hypothetical protein